MYLLLSLGHRGSLQVKHHYFGRFCDISELVRHIICVRICLIQLGRVYRLYIFRRNTATFQGELQLFARKASSGLERFVIRSFEYVTDITNRCILRRR
jgi:hypothetical protein